MAHVCSLFMFSFSYIPVDYSNILFRIPFWCTYCVFFKSSPEDMLIDLRI